MSACDFSYLAGCSYPGFTVVGDGVYLLATRMSNMVKQEAMFLEVSEFLLTIRRPLFRFIVHLQHVRFITCMLYVQGMLHLWGCFGFSPFLGGGPETGHRRVNPGSCNPLY